MTKENIIKDNLKELVVIAYNADQMAKDPECPNPEKYAKMSDDAVQRLFDYMQNLEEA